MQTGTVRLNYWAIGVAAIACFLFEALWYTIFLQTWLEGIGRSRQWLMASGVNPYLQYGTALLSAAVIAVAIDCVTQLTGPQTAIRGIKAATLLWVAFVLTTFSTEYVFEVRPLSLLGVNAGFWFLGMGMMGAIVGAWPGRKVAGNLEINARSSFTGSGKNN
jgi:hypothetical protein